MAELQVPDYMTNRPVSITDLAESMMRMKESGQNQRLNEMKMAEAQQLAPYKQRFMQSQAIENESTANLNQSKTQLQQRNFAIQGAKQAVGYANKIAKEGTPEWEQAVLQAATPIAQALGHNDPNKPIDIPSVKTLANMDSGVGEYHPPVQTSTGYLQYGQNGFEPMLDKQGNPYMPPVVDIGLRGRGRLAEELAQLYTSGGIDQPTYERLLAHAVSGQQQDIQQPMPQAPQQQARPQVHIDPNMSLNDQALAQEDWANYEQGVASQPAQGGGVPAPSGGIKSDTQRLAEKQAIEDASKAPEREQSLSASYQGESKNYRDLSEAYKKTIPLFDRASQSAPATLAAVTNFMKLLDPASVVKETELEMALNATGLSDKYTNLPKTWVKGQVLTPSQVAEFKKVMTDVYKSSTAQQRQIDKGYKERAERNKLNPKNIIQDVGQYGSYKSAEEVKAAYKNGDLTIDEAKDILTAKFD